MRRGSSVVQAVLRAHLVSAAAFAATIVAVGGVATVAVVVHRDDLHALALARTLGSELIEHAADPRAAQDELVVEELAEEQWFARRIEVWRAGDRVGGTIADGQLGAWEGSESCDYASIAGIWQRVCAARTDATTTIAVGSPLGAILADVVPLATVMALTVVTVTLVLMVLGRAWLRRKLSPLAEFERQVGALPAQDRSQRVECVWGIAEVDALASTLNGLLERIHRAVEREQRFVADAAHELRTPLTRLRAQLELAAEELRDGRLPHERVAAAARTSEELGRTTEVLLALARNQVTIEEAVDLEDVVAACVACVAAEEAARVVVRAGEEAIVRGDERLLRLAVGNLVENALKYSTGPVTIAVTAGDRVRVRVEDTGPGLAEAELTRVRQPFVRGANTAAVHGVGLGLALVDHVATLHGGSLALATAGGLRATLEFSPWQAAGGG